MQRYLQQQQSALTLDKSTNRSTAKKALKLSVKAKLPTKVLLKQTIVDLSEKDVWAAGWPDVSHSRTDKPFLKSQIEKKCESWKIL